MCVFVQQFYERNTDEGKASGLTVAVKDSIHVAGYPSWAGCKALRDVQPELEHAEVVHNLLKMGCSLLGKTNMHELAYGMTGLNEWHGTPVNALFPEYIPGGSSSGSAVAVAADMVDFSIGTDTGGSIRVPAACCGVYGFKPTFGRVSRRGVLPQESSLDCVGPFAGSAEMLYQAMQAIDPSFQGPAGLSLDKLTLGVIDVAADPAIWAVLNQSLVQANVCTQPLTMEGIETAFAAGMSLINRETWNAYQHLADNELLGGDVKARLNNAANTSDEDIARAERVRAEVSQEVDRLLEQVDFLVLPTLPSFPMFMKDAEAGKTDLNISALVRPFNLTGHPALSIPLVAEGHRPAGMQLVGRKGSDEHLCELACLLSPFISKPKNPNKKSVGF